MAAPLMSSNLLSRLVRVLLLRRKLLIERHSTRGYAEYVEDENCDFYGIPENYSLQQYRHAEPVDIGKVRERLNLDSTPHHSHRRSLVRDHGPEESNVQEAYHAQRRPNKKELRPDTTQSRQSISNRRLKVVRDISSSSPQPLPDTDDTGRRHSVRERSNKADCSSPSRNMMKDSVEVSKDDFDKGSSNSNLFDSQYFGNLSHDSINVKTNSLPPESVVKVNETSMHCNDRSKVSVGSKNVRTVKVINLPESKPNPRDDRPEDLNLFDDYYFGESLHKEELLELMPKPGNDSDLSAIDEQYFGQTNSEGSPGTQGAYANFNDVVSSYTSREGIEFQNDVDPINTSKKVNDNVLTNKNMLHRKSYLQRFNPNSDNKVSAQTFGKSNLNTDTELTTFYEKLKTNIDRNVPTTAFDLAMEIRKGNIDPQAESSLEHKGSSHSDLLKSLLEDGFSCKKGKLDGKGFRILSDQVPDFHKMPSMDIVEMLRNSIVFDHEDFLVIDKPYGLPSIGQEQDRCSLSSLLPALGQSLPRKSNASDLHLVNGIDRDVTGGVMVAKNPEVAYMLKAKFKANEIIQRFKAITKGVPSPQSGVIDIPIGVGKVGNIHKMVPRPQKFDRTQSLYKNSRAPCKKAITEFHVLSSYLEAALVECRILTDGVKHQLRVHLASGLNTPILGDHKYSHFSKLVPQKLNRSTLELLQVRQAKVRHIPLHLHGHCLVLPDYKSRTLVITCHLPHHFSKNMKRLKLYNPK